jgi:hypothetical protein
MRTDEDNEREAWAAGDYMTAALYGRIIELQKALGETLAENEELQTLLNRHAAIDRIERVLQ